jgi:hypothetical protein
VTSIPWVLLLSLLVPHGSHPVCDPLWLPITRDPNLVFFVATVRAHDDSSFAARIHIKALESPPIPGDSAWLVPWDYGPDCAPLPWRSPASWRPPSSAAVYTGYLRPQAQWLGRPTVDLRMAVLQPLWQAQDPRWPGPREGIGLLSPAEFLSLLAALPTPHALAREPQSVRGALDRWESTHPALARREPAATMLANLRRALASGVGKPR